MHDPLEVRGWPSLLFKGKESYNVRRAGSMNHIRQANCAEYEFYSLHLEIGCGWKAVD
jgi:hypothetical protein